MLKNSLHHRNVYSSTMALIAGLILFAAFLISCRQVKKSWEVSRRAVDEFQEQKADALCSRFSEEMQEVMPCDSLERIIRQTSNLHGRPAGKCKWHYTWQFTRLDPLRSVTRYKCPYTKGPIIITVVVDVADNGAFVTGLWADSERIRKQRLLTRVELCEEVNENTNQCDKPIERADWSRPRISVWTSWQGVRKGDRLIMEWFSPQGKSVFDFDQQAKNTSSRPFYFWSYLEPEKVKLEDPLGRWTVKIGVNGKLVEEYQVEVAAGKEQ